VFPLVEEQGKTGTGFSMFCHAKNYVRAKKGKRARKRERKEMLADKPLPT